MVSKNLVLQKQPFVGYEMGVLKNLINLQENTCTGVLFIRVTYSLNKK